MLDWLRRKDTPPDGKTVAEAGRALAAGEDARAIDLLDAHLRRYASDTQALHLRAVAACRAGDFDLAQRHLTAAVELDPGFAEAAVTLAEVHRHHGRFDAAAEAFRLAVAAAPQRIDLRRRLMIALGMAGRESEAVQMYVLLRLQAQGFESPDNPAATLVAQGRLVDAEALLEGKLRRDFDDARLHHYLGMAREARGRIAPAIEAFREAVRIEPGFAPALRRLGFCLESTGDHVQAMQCYRLAVEHAPAEPAALSEYLSVLHYAADIGRDETARAYRAWDERFARPIAEAGPAPEFVRDPGRKLRVGYVSADFYSHVTRHFIEPVLEHHDRERFDVYCYDNSPMEDAVTARLRALPVTWRPVQDIDDETLARQVREDRIDILVDLNGHLFGNRLLAFARRPAPLQATWLGYPNTTGLGAMDYWITDRNLAADLSDQYHSERLLVLDGFYMPFRPGALPPVEALPPSLRGAPVTFGSFNLYPKIGGQVLDAWARLLLRVPGARLKMFAIPAAAHPHVRARFGERGIAADRLDLEDRIAHEAFLAAHGDVDVALDPFPCVGTTTTLFTLAMGVPLVTLAGRTHASRVSASALAEVGLASLVAETVDDYVALAARTVADADLLRACRAGLRGRLEASIMDERGFTRRLEAGYREAWRRRCAD